MSEITKEEIQVLVDSNTKVSTALQIIADKLNTCAEKLNEMSKTITGRQKQYDIIDELKPDVSSIKDIITKAVWFIGIVGLVVIVATVILRGLDTRMIAGKPNVDIEQDHRLLEQIQTDLLDHMKEVSK